MAKKLPLFISHLTEETEVAVILKTQIEESFLGFVEIFVSSDGECIDAGRPWLASIERALQAAKIMIILSSQESIAKPWINFEAGAGWLKGIPVIPLCHHGMKRGELPMPLSVLQSLEADNEDHLHQLFKRIAKEVGCDVPKGISYGKLKARIQAALTTPEDEEESHGPTPSDGPKLWLELKVSYEFADRRLAQICQ